jgi:hypothetical protein
MLDGIGGLHAERATWLDDTAPGAGSAGVD